MPRGREKKKGEMVDNRRWTVEQGKKNQQQVSYKSGAAIQQGPKDLNEKEQVWIVIEANCSSFIYTNLSA